MMFIRQTIEIRPSNKQKTYFRKCFGARRLAYNYGLQEWIRRRDNGEKTNCRDIRTQFNNEKRAGRWPFLYSLSSSATCFAFDDLKRAFDNFFDGHDKLKQGTDQDVSGFPKPKSKSYKEGSYTEYFSTKGEGGAKILDHPVKMKMSVRRDGIINVTYKDKPKAPDANPDRPYLLLPRLGTVRMTRRLRYEGRPVSVTVRQHNERFYACFLIEVTDEEFYRLHPRYAATPQLAVGIDLGIKEMAVTSDGLLIENPKYWKRQLKHLNVLQKRMNHCNGKRYDASPSRRFLKAKQKVWRLSTHIKNQRNDLRNKFCAAVLANYQHIGIETLDVSVMQDTLTRRRDKRGLNARLRDVSLYEIRHRLETIGEIIGRNIVAAPKKYRSTRTCCVCGHVEPHMKLTQRIYCCPECGNEIDRDLNAAINLRNLTGRGKSGLMSEVSPMRSELIKSNIQHRVIGDGKKVGTRS